MTSFPGAGLARRRSSADWPASIIGTTGTTAGTVARCQVNDDQLARRWPCRQLPAVDHPQTGRRRSSAPRARPRGRPRRCQVNDDQLARRQLPGCRSTGTAARANRRNRGDRGTMTSLPALALPAVDRHAARPRRQLPAVDHPQTGRRRSSAPRARPRGRPRHCQVNDDQLARRWPCPPSIIGTTGTAAGEAPALPSQR